VPVAGLMNTFPFSHLSCRFVLHKQTRTTSMHKEYYGQWTISDVSHIICRYEKGRSIVTASIYILKIAKRICAKWETPIYFARCSKALPHLLVFIWQTVLSRSLSRTVRHQTPLLFVPQRSFLEWQVQIFVRKRA